MKKLLVLSIIMLQVFAVEAQKIINDENVQARNVGSFTAIKVSHAIDLFLSQGNEEALAVSAKNEEYRNNIKTAVENGVLKIWYDDGDKFWNSGNKRLRAYVSVRTLNKLTASGASDVHIDGTIKVDQLVLNLSGASDLKGAFEANQLDVDLSGASDATISGSVATLKIEASGASDFKGYDLEADNCSAQASGASDIKVTVNKELTAHASGASGVYYRGSGVIRDIKTSGASNVGKKG